MKCPKAPLAQSALPNDKHAPAEPPQPSYVTPVAQLIALQLSAPKFGIGLGQNRKAAASMTVPKAAMNKNHRTMSMQDKVGPARQFTGVKTVAESLTV